MLELVKQLNDAKFDDLLKFEISGQHVGYVRPDLAEKLIDRAPNFIGQTSCDTISVLAEGLTAEQLSEQLKSFHENMAAEGILPKPVAEFTDLRKKITDEPLCKVNLRLIFPLGIINRGVHVVMTHENGDFVIAKRSNKVFTYQGCWDVPVGGVLPSGRDPWEQVKREAAEEGGLKDGDIHPNGDAVVLSYARNVQGQMKDGVYKPAFPFETDGGTNWDEVYYWTATLPDGVIPTPRDGEVKSFHRMAPEALVSSLRNEPEAWKTNSGVMFLQVLAASPTYGALFSAEEKQELKALQVPDARPYSIRGEVPYMNKNNNVIKPSF